VVSRIGGAADGVGGRGEKPRRRAAFLDRDGTLIVEKHYLADPAGVELIPGVGAALRELRRAGYALIVVTNQSGLARGVIRPDDYAAVERRVAELLAAEGVTLDGVYHCPHHPDVSGPCECRKPGLGLYRRAAAEHGLELAGSLFVGDRERDVIPALALGGTGYLVRTGYGATAGEAVPPGVRIARDLAEAVRDYLRSAVG